MKKFYSLFLSSLIFSFGAIVSSCSDDETKKDDTNGEVETPDVTDENVLGADTPTPINNVGHLKAEGGNDGVTIEVVNVENETFTFTLKPGRYIQSYKLDVYPLASLYNYLYESKKTKPDAKVEDLIYESMFAGDGSGAFSFSVNNLDDWNLFELNWGESIYKQGDIVPDATYVIVAIGCQDEEAVIAGDLTMCYVKTTAEPLIGEPKVYIETNSGYSSIVAKFTPNNDTYYFYQFCSLTEEIEEFIGSYGNDIYTDLIRTWYAEATNAKEDDTDFTMSWTFNSPDAQVSMTASSVALDKNKTKGELTKEIVNLKQIPADALDAKYDVKLSRVSARRADLEVGLYNSTNVMFYHIMTSSEWNSTKDDPAALAALKSSIETGGWAVDNRDEQKAGVEYNTKTVYNYLLNEDTEYVIVSLARNIYMQYTDPVATEPFRTKPIVKDNPEASISQVKVTLTDAGRTAFRSNYEYSEGTALFYHQYIIDHSLITDFLNGDKTRLTNYLMDNTDVLDVNIWPGIDDKEYSNFYWDGMDPAQKYYYAMIGEDWNGVFSEISIDSISTLAVIGGPNPEVKIQSLITDNNDWFVNFAIVQDVVNMRYMILEDTYSTDPDFTFDDCKQFWTDLLIGEGGFTSVNSGSVSVPIKNNVRYIALAVPYGIDADNKEFQGSLYMQGFDLSINPSDPNKCIVLQDDFENVFFNNRTRAVSSTSVNAVSPRVIEIPRLKASDIPTMKTEIEGNSVDKTIFMNIKKLGSSPKISTK